MELLVATEEHVLLFWLRTLKRKILLRLDKNIAGITHVNLISSQ